MMGELGDSSAHLFPTAYHYQSFHAFVLKSRSEPCWHIKLRLQSIGLTLQKAIGSWISFRDFGANQWACHERICLHTEQSVIEAMCFVAQSTHPIGFTQGLRQYMTLCMQHSPKILE